MGALSPLVVALLIAIVGVFVVLCDDAVPCTEDDYLAAYTACRADNTRDLLYYKNPASTCEGGATQPPNVFNLRCDITCTAGTYLPLGAQSCANCSAGDFSVGGGSRVSNWVGFPRVNNDLMFSTYSATIKNNNFTNLKPYGGWVIATDTTLAILSGIVNNSQASILYLPLNLVRDGYVKFTYKVDSEPRFDGLNFQIDNVKAMTMQWTVLEFTTMQYSLTKGYHLLQWVYAKDSTISKGLDRATIRSVEVTGIDYADDSCTECSPGTYNNLDRQAECKVCPRNTFNTAVAATNCTPCPADQYSLEGATSCLPRTTCKYYDYVMVLTQCELREGAPKRDILYKWLDSTTCNTAAATLPPSQFNVECGPCNAGQYRPAGTATCRDCDPGYMSDVGASVCAPCSAGQQADAGYYYTQFNSENELPFITSCTGSCGTKGWLIAGDQMNSGTGHGRYVTSQLQFTVEVAKRGLLFMTVAINCTRMTDCYLQFSDRGKDSKIFYPLFGRNQDYSVNVEAGNHTFTWTFNKQSTSTVTPSDRAIIRKIYITTYGHGGARTCTNCSAGMFSLAASSQCRNCSAGTSSSSGSGACTPCQANSFNPIPGGICLSCGANTHSGIGAVNCTYDCTFSPDNGATVFDLNGLKSTDNMYGPVYDQKKMAYYVNVCSLQHNNYSCFDREGKPIASFACQITNLCNAYGQCVGMSLGDIIGFLPLPAPNQKDGLVLAYTHGTVGCNGQSRELNITFRCSPGAGIGYPEPPPTKYIETTPCKYNIVWESDYGCPLCTSEYYSYYLTPCENNQRTKVYFWNDNPKHCHDGVTLPASEVIQQSCTSTTICPAGQYATSTGTCQDCELGTYSPGPGNVYTSFQSIPTGFTTSCSGVAGCQGFQAQGGLLVTSGGTSVLAYAANFLVAGQISFSFKVFASGLQGGPGSGTFIFALDGVALATYTTTSFDYQHVTFPVTTGSHMLQWTYYGGVVSSLSSDMLSGMAISMITVLGTDYSPLQCTPCEGGTYQNNAGVSSCLVCEENTFSAGGASVCTACPYDEYSVAHSKSCTARSVCTASDYQMYYTACSAGSRIAYYLPLEPNSCVGGYIPPLPAEGQPCVACAAGMFKPEGSDECTGCPSGQYLSGETCVSAQAGTKVENTLTFFGGAGTGDTQEAEWPTGWTTSCYGHCGTFGWRIRSGYVDSGVQLAGDSVMSVLTYTTALATDGTVSFKYTLANTAHSGLQFFVNGIRQEIPITLGAAWVNVTIPVTAEATEFAWVYVQNPSSTASMAQVSKIAVSGVPVGVGSTIDCPIGTASEIGASSCTACAAGTYSNTERTSQCIPCANGMFSDGVGATECQQCYLGTTSEKESGSTKCVSSCMFNTTVDGRTYTYDLSDMAHTVGPITGPSDTVFYFDLCDLGVTTGVCVDTKGNDMATHVCQIVPVTSSTYSFGDVLEFVPTGTSGFSLFFHDGDSTGCTATSPQRETSISFECDVDAGTGSPKYVLQSVQDPCAVTFLWESVLACPVCTEEDYRTVVGECSDGLQAVQLIRDADCYGPASKTSASLSCSEEQGVPVLYIIIGLVGVGVVVMIMAAVIVVVLIRHRRMSLRYSKLVNDQKIENDNF